MQRTEWYNEHLIVYSLSNFIFDQLFSPDVQRGLVVTAELFLPLEQEAIDNLAVLSDCSSFKDNCWGLMALLDLPKLDYTSHFSGVVTTGANRPEKHSQKLGAPF